MSEKEADTPAILAQGLWGRQLLLGPMQNFVYLLGPEGGGEAVVVDPAWDVPAILAALAAARRTLTGIILTHGHNDHVNGVPELLRTHDVPVYAQAEEVEFFDALKAIRAAILPIAGSSELRVGGLTLKLIHSPGHTPGSQCLWCQGAVFTGDTLFLHACGRCDFRGGDAKTMYRTLTHLRETLPGETRVFAGHDYSKVRSMQMRDVLAENPYYQLADETAFVRERVKPRG
ncbi:MAG: MBL fold metallo-hydrolase [Myxococcaceae bacterium]